MLDKSGVDEYLYKCHEKKSDRNILYGSLILGAGVRASMISFVDAGSTGAYIPSTSALLGGGGQLFKGLSY